MPCRASPGSTLNVVRRRAVRRMAGPQLRWRLCAALAVLPRVSSCPAGGDSSLLLKRLQGAGNRRTPARTGDSSSTNQASGDEDSRPVVLGGGESAAAEGTLAILHHHASHAASVASALGGEAVDVRAASGSPAE